MSFLPTNAIWEQITLLLGPEHRARISGGPNKQGGWKIFRKNKWGDAYSGLKSKKIHRIQLSHINSLLTSSKPLENFAVETVVLTLPSSHL